jgi:uncharacterized linocin/CFP29 family protein
MANAKGSEEMANDHPQVPWTTEQWARATRVIAEEANRARVAATFLPLHGPLAPSADYVASDRISYGAPGAGPQRMTIDDTTTMLLPTLQVKVYLRGAQMADPEMTSALALLRRAANVLARLEDAVVFNGQAGPGQGPAAASAGLPAVWEILGGQQSRGLLSGDAPDRLAVSGDAPGTLGEALVSAVSDGIGRLEARGHFGPFAVALDQHFFTAVQTPNRDSLVLPQDRIIPFLGGGSLVRSSTLPGNTGVVVALGGEPVELVVATDVSLNFLQVTTDPMFAFRVFEKIVLRIKEPEAIVALGSVPSETAPSPGTARGRGR